VCVDECDMPSKLCVPDDLVCMCVFVCVLCIYVHEQF
jgi:hypothetical protein